MAKTLNFNKFQWVSEISRAYNKIYFTAKLSMILKYVIEINFSNFMY